MPTYFPYLRGKQHELIALRELRHRLSMDSSVQPIIELVNANPTTLISLDQYVEAMMPFVLVTNPKHGAFKGEEKTFHDTFVRSGTLGGYDRYIPALHLDHDTTIEEVKAFLKGYDACSFRAVIYNGQPVTDEVLNWCATDGRIYHHIIMEGAVTSQFVEAIPKSRRVIMRDNFKRQIRNADYPTVPELFTDMNTASGNRDGVDWGDYTIQGNHFSESGGPAMAVAIHHLHFNSPGAAIYVSHFLSDRQETTADPMGKAMEAVENLVSALDVFQPNNTSACEEYRKMAMSGDSKGLGYLKRLGIIHHLELVLDNE